MDTLPEGGGVADVQTPSVKQTTGTCSGKKHNGFTWEHAAILILGGAAIVSSGLLYTQWKHAAVGRKISGDVVDFLKLHGAQVSGKKILGGPVSVPMDLDEAVISTVDTILGDITHRAKRPPSQQPDQGPAAPTPSNGGRPAPGHAPQAPAPAPMPATSGGATPAFPDPPISGRTGMPISQGAMMQSGSISGSGYPSESAARDEDFSYSPPMPPGMRPPSQML